MAITLENGGALRHTFTAAELDGAAAFRYSGDVTRGAQVENDVVDVPLDAGTRAELRLRFDSPGRYEFWCEVPGHRRAGMHGTILVR